MANLTHAQLQQLIPNASITKELVDLQIECAVCLDEFYLNENGVRKLKCNHLFHSTCIFPWLQRNASCPVCRTKLSIFNETRVSFAEIQTQVNLIRTDMANVRVLHTVYPRRQASTAVSFRFFLQSALPPNEAPLLVTLNNRTTTTSSTANVNEQMNRAPPPTLFSSTAARRSENPVGPLRANLNVNVQTIRPHLESVARTVGSNGHENRIGELGESTYTADGVRVPRRGAALRARDAIAGIYRRQRRTENGKSVQRN